MKRPHFTFSAAKTPASLLEAAAFTLLELMTVMAIIAVLAGLVLKGAGYAQNKAARDRASAEIAAISVALESYKADNGEYPNSSVTSGTLSKSTGASTGYVAAGYVLFDELSNPTVANTANRSIYFEAKPDIRSTGTGAIVSGSTYFVDPFGNPYGYQTPTTTGTNTYNPTYDLWSTAGQSGSGTANKQEKWITNW